MYWICNCDCGSKNIEIAGERLRQNLTYSCGCINSRGEEKISNILAENNINFLREYKPKDFVLSTGGQPRYDFAILNSDKTISYFIEYHGIQHYLFTPQGRYNQEEIDKIDIRDYEKKQYCINNNIPLIEIPYYKFNNLTINDLYFPELIH